MKQKKTVYSTTIELPEETLASVYKSLESGGTVKIPKVGVIRVSNLRARQGFVPSTGTYRKIKKSRRAVFKSALALRKVLS